MRVYAFQGIRYAGDGDPGSLAAPPYDQIDDRLREELHSRSDRHFAHLSRPVPGAGGDAYHHAARLHSSWLEAGILRADGTPSLYPYEIRLASGGRRLGVCALVGVEGEGGLIRPHEATLAKPLADRLDLLRAMAVDLEPILLLADDKGGIDRLLTEDLEGAGGPLVEHPDAGGNRHLLYRLEEQERIDRYKELLGPCPGLIADGHHRYRVAQLFAAEVGAEPGSPAAMKLAVVTSLASPELAIDPIHRALTRAPGDLAPALSLASSRRPWEGISGADLAAAVAEAPQPALGVWLAGQIPEVWVLEPRGAPGEVPAPAARLPVVLLHRALLPALGLGEEAASDGTIRYRSNPEELFAQVSQGEVEAGFWLPPMPPADFAAAIAPGELLPPKSTRFLPKVASGLVWAGHDSALA